MTLRGYLSRSDVTEDLVEALRDSLEFRGMRPDRDYCRQAAERLLKTGEVVTAEEAEVRETEAYYDGLDIGRAGCCGDAD